MTANRTRNGGRTRRTIRWAPPDTCPECGAPRNPPWRSTLDGEGGICGSYQCRQCKHLWYQTWAVEAL